MDKIVVEESLTDIFPYVESNFQEARTRRGLILNESKSVKSVPSINILGYCVGHNSIKPDAEGLQPLDQLPPQLHLPLHRTLGMFAYNSKWIPEILQVMHFYLFAHDTNIYYAADTIKKVGKVIIKELQRLIENTLSINITKTNFLVFHPYNNPLKQRITLKIHKMAVAESEYIKYVMFDSTLTWNSHIDKISKTLSRATCLLYKIRPVILQLGISTFKLCNRSFGICTSCLSEQNSYNAKK